MQLNQEVSKEQLHPEMPNETGNKWAEQLEEDKAESL